MHSLASFQRLAVARFRHGASVPESPDSEGTEGRFEPRGLRAL